MLLLCQWVMWGTSKAILRAVKNSGVTVHYQSTLDIAFCQAIFIRKTLFFLAKTDTDDHQCPQTSVDSLLGQSPKPCRKDEELGEGKITLRK